MSKLIVIYCDGTWNSPTLAETTNVVELSDATAQTDSQISVYINGVGTGDYRSKLRGWINKIGGGAFGWGLNARIREGYQAVIDHYEPGDRIMVFGFSRGAYTARSIVGMIRKCGVPDKDEAGFFDMVSAFRLYRKGGPENHPDMPHIMKQRHALSPRFATSKADLEARDGTKDVHLVNVAYLGVWDTVGSLGLPEPLLGGVARILNRRYQFHDTDLSSMVGAARHAVALDERRKFYKPALWFNLDAHTRPDGRPSLGLNQGTTGPQRPFQQVWFIGNHGIVGGSSDMQGLVAIPRDWVLEGAKARGLVLKPDAAFNLPDPLEPGNAGSASGLYKVARDLLAWRSGPQVEADLHPTVDERVIGVPDYRPETLKVVRADILSDTRFT